MMKKTRGRLEDHIIEGHVTTAGTAIIAKEAKVGKLVLVHHAPFANNKKLREQLLVAQSIFPPTILSFDLKEISF